MEQNLAIAAVWMGLALIASLLSIRLGRSVALVEVLEHCPCTVRIVK